MEQFPDREPLNPFKGASEAPPQQPQTKLAAEFRRQFKKGRPPVLPEREPPFPQGPCPFTPPLSEHVYPAPVPRVVERRVFPVVKEKGELVGQFRKDVFKVTALLPHHQRVEKRQVVGRFDAPVQFGAAFPFVSGVRPVFRKAATVV